MKGWQDAFVRSNSEGPSAGDGKHGSISKSEAALLVIVRHIRETNYGNLTGLQSISGRGRVFEQIYQARRGNIRFLLKESGI